MDGETETKGETKQRAQTSPRSVKYNCCTACESYDEVTNLANMIAEQFEEITQNGIPIGPLSEEDSLITSIDNVVGGRHKFK